MTRNLISSRLICSSLLLLASQTGFSQETDKSLFQLKTKNQYSNFVSQLNQGHFIGQLGWFSATAGRAQNVYIQDLIGDHFSATDRTGSNGLVGLGYFLNGMSNNQFDLLYGINAFYLFKTSVSGYVTQEELFTNLSYHYNVTHVPIYAAVKANIKTNWNRYRLTMDAGIGPNIISTHNFSETALNTESIPDHIFSGKTNATFSAMAGVGLKVNNVFGKLPMECGYRFFYLGEGSFNNLTNQVTNTLKTGNSYAQAIVCGVTA